MTPNRPEAGNMQMTDEQEHAIAHAQRVLRAVKLYDHAELLSASKPAAIDGQEAAIRAVAADIEEMTVTELRAKHELHRNGDIAIALRELSAAPSPAQTERGAFTEWWDCEYGCTFDNIPGAMGGAFREVAQKAWNRRAALQAAPAAEKPKLTVWYGPMPESNGKTNWTAILHRGDLSQGHTIDRSEYPDRVRYESDCVRWLIGELTERPWILDYDADKHSGYVAPQPAADAPGMAEPVAWFYYEDDEFIRMYASEEKAVAACEKFGGHWRAVYTHPAAPAQSGEPVADPKHDLHARLKIAREAGLQLRIDAKFGSDRYHSVTGSWPAVCRFAWALYNTAPQPAQTAQSDVCECGYSIETSCNVLDPACRRYTGKPAPSAVALDDDRAAFEAWAKEALEAHYDEHDSLITYDPVSAWLAWQASRRAALEEAAQLCANRSEKAGTIGRALEAMDLALAIRALSGATEA